MQKQLVVLLHLYQPSLLKTTDIQKTFVWYRRLFGLLLRQPQIKVGLAVAGGYLKIVTKLDQGWLATSIRNLARRGQIHFYQTSPFGSFLPLLPASSIQAELALNHRICQRLWGKLYQPVGLYSPLAAYSRKLLTAARRFDLGSLVVDELSVADQVNQIEHIRRLKSQEGDCRIYLNQRRLTQALFYSPQVQNLHQLWPYLKEVNVFVERADYFRPPAPPRQGLLLNLLKSKKVATCFFSQLSRGGERQKVKLRAGSDQTWPSELKIGVAYPTQRWPGNELHQLQWRLVKLAWSLVKPDDWRRWQKLSRLLFYDQFWMMSGGRPWGLANYLSFRAACQLVNWVRQRGNHPELVLAERTYRRLLVRSYQREKEGWPRQVFDLDQKMLAYRRSLVPGLPLTSGHELARRLARQERTRTN